MATEGFGASFGNPSKYMGQSPLSDIGSALKAFGMATALEKSGAKEWLNSLGIKQNAEGKLKIQGSAPAPMASAAPVRPGASPAPMPLSTPAAAPMAAASTSVGNDVLDGNFHGVSMPQPTTYDLSGSPVYQSKTYDLSGAPMIFGSSEYGGKNRDYAPPTSGYADPEMAPVVPKSVIGTPISVVNPNDYDPRENYGYTQQLASGNEYQNTPGYGSTAKKMSSLFGMA
jgi:hypothetical protein